MTEPVILLDFDGVINAVIKFSKVPGTETLVPPKMLTNVWPEHTWRHVDWEASGHAWPIKWSTDVVRQINALAEHMGLPHLETHEAPEYSLPEGQLRAHLMARGKPGWWKYPAAERVLTEERRPLGQFLHTLENSNAQA